MGMLAKWSGSASSDCSRWMEHRRKSPRLIVLKYINYNQLLAILNLNIYLEAIFISRSGRTVSSAVTR